MTRHLHIDIETYSSEPLDKCGVYRYAEAPDFQVLLVAYAFNNDPVQVVDLTSGKPMPKTLRDAILDPGTVKVAHNATFERICLSRHFGLPDGQYLDPGSWTCTMVMAGRCGLPLSLAQCGAALGLDEQKMTEGKALINLFCKPHTSKDDHALLFEASAKADPTYHPEEWRTFKNYCKRDVEVERSIYRALSWLDQFYEPSEMEASLYALDQHINDRGVLIDTALAENADLMYDIHKAHLRVEAAKITGLSNPNSPAQLKVWLTRQTGVDVDKLNKSVIASMQDTFKEHPEIRRVLQIRSAMGKTSIAKYPKMLQAYCHDHRVRGVSQFYGTHTGRWAGRILQTQNLPQNHIDNIEFARQCVIDKDPDLLELCYGSVPDCLSQLIRTALIAKEGHTFCVCDFSAIEARVVAWLAGEDWVLDVFRKGRDIYCETASQMFGVPVEKHGVNAGLRQKGKIAVLALGYEGGTKALDNMGAARMGITEEEKVDIVTRWRATNPHIVASWRLVEDAVRKVVTGAGELSVLGLTFCLHDNGAMVITLPSGRPLVYDHMTVSASTRHRGKNSLTYMGVEQNTKLFGPIETFGGRLVENIVQAIARDCLAEVMLAVEAAGYPIVFHVHDELICEVPDGNKALEDITHLFAISPSWAEGLPLKGAGYITPFYIKD